MKFAFCFNVENHLYDSFGGQKLHNSIRYFYPNAIIDWYDSKEINRIITQYPWSNRLSFMPCIMKDCMEKNKVDRVIKIDADSLVLGTLDEAIDNNFDICGVRNDCDDHTQDESHNRPLPIKNLPNNKYLNCGFISTTSISFLNNWIELNKYVINKYGSINYFTVVEQDSYNILVHSTNWKLKILDPLGGNLFYGASANFDSKNGYVAPSVTKEYGGNFKNWSSWRDIEYKDGKFWLNNKICKVLHKAGGGKYENGQKLDWDLFNPNIVPKLQEITQCQT